MATFSIIGIACVTAAQIATSPSMARSGHGSRHSIIMVLQQAGSPPPHDGFTCCGGYTPLGQNYPYYWDAGYVPEPHYGFAQRTCQPGTIFFGEDGQRHLCE